MAGSRARRRNPASCPAR